MAVALVRTVPVAHQTEHADAERCQRPVDGADAGYGDAQGERGLDAVPPQLRHAAIVARWRTLRCNICRRPLQRALLMPGSATLATCRRDRVTFVFVVTETGKLLVMRREKHPQ